MVEIVLFLLLASSSGGLSHTSSVTASGLELQTNHRRSFQNEGLLLVESAFTFKTISRDYAKQALTIGKS